MIKFTIFIKLLIVLGVTVLSKNNSRRNKIKFKSNSPLNSYETAAVVSNVPECARIGSDIMRYKNGTAVDAAIAVLICEGVTAPIRMGIGGGFLMTIYDAPTGKAEFLVAKEMAPGLANSTMYAGKPTYFGGLAVAVPGQILGFWKAHKKYGRVAWKDLFEPSIELCIDGYVCNAVYSDSLKSVYDECRNESTLLDFFVDPQTNKSYTKGDVIRSPKMAETLRKLADATDPVELFYKGEIAEQLVAEIKEHGGIITTDDFANYRVKWTEPHRAEIDNMTIFTSSPPGSGVLLTFMLKVLKNLVPAKNDKILCQRFVETFKFAFAKRSELADPDFVDTEQVIANLTSAEYIAHVRSLIRDDKTYEDPKHYGAESWTKPDGGTSHVSVIAPDGSAVSVTSSINEHFGARFASRSTGIVFNNQMDDFGSPGIINIYGVPGSPKNFIQPRKRPLSSMVPTIAIDENGKVKMVIGAAGGTKIPTSVAYIMSLYLWNGYNLKESVDAYRLHHQLYPKEIWFQPGFPSKIMSYLKKIGHKEYFAEYDNAATAIAIENGIIVANADYRRGGATAGF